jgi:hypothetical protein
MATRATIDIGDDVKAVLRNAEIEGSELTLPNQLERKLYERTNKVLEILGFKWNRGRNAHVLPGGGDAKAVVKALVKALDAGSIVDPVKATQFYPTPPAVAELMVRLTLGSLLSVPKKVRILEPSAGKGAIISAVRAKYSDALFDVCEIDPARAQQLSETPGVTVVGADFLQYTVFPANGYKVILMNPPFSNGQDVAHVRHALTMLSKSGGYMAAVMAGSVQTREDRSSKALRQELAATGADYEFRPLPADSFRESGTGVNAVVLSVWS